MKRKEYLKTQNYGKLQSTSEFKHYCDTYLNVWLMNEEVEYILKKSYEDSEAPFSYDDFESFYTDEEGNEHQTEVMQWFLVCDDRIINELEKRGEVILKGKFWGRQAYGQSITMDGVIIEIFKEWYLELYGLPFDLEKEVSNDE